MDERDAREILERFGTFVDQFGGCFSRRPQREAARRYLDGLFNDSERKSMQAMHGRLSDPATYQALQHFVTHSPWEADALWTRLRAVVPIREGLLAVDDVNTESICPLIADGLVLRHRRPCPTNADEIVL